MCFVLLCSFLCVFPVWPREFQQTDPTKSTNTHNRKTGISKYTHSIFGVFYCTCSWLSYSTYNDSCTNNKRRKRMFDGCQWTTVHFISFDIFDNILLRIVIDLRILLPERILNEQNQQTCDERYKVREIYNRHHQTLGSLYTRNGSCQWYILNNSENFPCVYKIGLTRTYETVHKEWLRVTETEMPWENKINISITHICIVLIQMAINCWLECICLVAWL